MKFNNWGRILVCLVLICALVINISPIKAQAAVPMSAMLIPVGMAVISWLIGLGVQEIQRNPDAFAGVVSAAESALDAAGYVVNGMVSVYNLSQGGFFVKQEILDFLHNWMFTDGGVVGARTFGEQIAPGYTVVGTNGATYEINDSCHLLYIKESGKYYYVFTADHSFKYRTFNHSENRWFDCTCTYYVNSGTGIKGYYVAAPVAAPSDADSGLFYNSSISSTVANFWAGTLSFAGTGSIAAISDVSLGHIALPDDGIESGYPAWVPSAVTIDGVETQMYPFGLAQTEEETKVLTQEQVWSGESSYTQEEIESTTQQQITVQGLDTHFYELGAKLAQWFSDLTTGVSSISQQILDGLGQILIDVLSYLFVPKQEFVQAKVTALTQEFAFAGAIVNTGKAITTGLSGISTQPPVIYVDLGANRGPHYLGGKVPFLDLRWYAEYKPTVDTLISAFLWICFVWRMLVKLPGIIGGMPGDFVYGAAHAMGLDTHLPSRNAAYEVTRAANREYIRKGPGK